MILVCYETKEAKGWDELPSDTNVPAWMRRHPDRTPTHVFKSGPEYQVDVIEQARFHAKCRAFGFKPEHYRKLAVDENNILELYGFQDGQCLLRNISTNQIHTMTREQAHKFLNIKDKE